MNYNTILTNCYANVQFVLVSRFVQHVVMTPHHEHNIVITSSIQHSTYTSTRFFLEKLWFDKHATPTFSFLKKVNVSKDI
jgi:hypothetical protein